MREEEAPSLPPEVIFKDMLKYKQPGAAVAILQP